MKGYLLIQPPAEFRKYILDKYTEDGTELSYMAKGWLPITHAIKEGAFLKVRADLNNIQVEARFNIQPTVVLRDPDNSYEVQGGVFEGRGTFFKVAREQNPEFNDFFICDSTSRSGRALRWEIGVNQIMDADTVSAES